MNNKPLEPLDLDEKYTKCEFYNSKNKISCYGCSYSGPCLMSKLNKIRKVCKENVIQEDYFDDYEKLGASNICKYIIECIEGSV